MDAFLRQLLATIRKHRLLEPGDGVRLGLSGGPDSVALLLALRQLQPVLSLRLSAAHFNHRLRGPASDRDEEFVRDLCRDTGIELQVEAADTQRLAAQSKTNLEDFARRQRYHFLLQSASRDRSKVATGHTLNDQAETFLMKLIRGSGPAGLSGIHPLRLNRVSVTGGDSKTVWVVRPLLECSREAVLGYLAAAGQDYREDLSNEDLSYERNWVRHHLIPLLQEKLNPALLTTLKRSAVLFREIEDFLLQQAGDSFRACCLQQDEDLRLDLPQLRKLAPIVQKEVIREAIRRCRGDLKGVTFEHVVQVAELASRVSGRGVHLPGGLRVSREFETMRFTRSAPTADFVYRLKIPGQIYVEEVGKWVRVREGEAGPASKAPLLRIPSSTVAVRNRRPGDRFQVASGGAPKKLKELLQRRRIPASGRARLIILQVGREIIWVEGLPLHPGYRARTGEGPVFEIEVESETLPADTLLRRGKGRK